MRGAQATLHLWWARRPLSAARAVIFAHMVDDPSSYVDALLGKRFALLGSTGTGKSTSAALILHKICEQSPKGHIVMIDPHGEYSAAFTQNGALYDASNLALPYWLMNFEGHCGVFVTSTGEDHARDSELLAKCLLAARAKNRPAEGLARLTVDSSVPYLLSDLTTIISNEMGKLDKGKCPLGRMIAEISRREEPYS